MAFFAMSAVCAHFGNKPLPTLSSLAATITKLKPRRKERYAKNGDGLPRPQSGETPVFAVCTKLGLKRKRTKKL